jgi:hypothetical protein
MKKMIVPLIMISALLGACGGDSDQPSERVSKIEPGPDETFVNPEFECPSANVVEPGEGYPYPLQEFPRSVDPNRSVAQLEEFCTRMAARFAESGLTVAEAKQVYEAIPAALTIRDEPYDMPSPDEPPLPPVDLESRVMLRKVGEGRYELFYFTIGCGRDYSLYELDLTGNAQARQIESWAERAEC